MMTAQSVLVTVVLLAHLVPCFIVIEDHVEDYPAFPLVDYQYQDYDLPPANSHELR